MSNIDKIQVGNTVYDIVSSSGTNTFTSGDVNDGEATSWTSVVKMTSGETTTSIIGKISNMFKNIRFLYSKLGSADISGIGNSLSEAVVSLKNTVDGVNNRIPVAQQSTAETRYLKVKEQDSSYSYYWGTLNYADIYGIPNVSSTVSDDTGLVTSSKSGVPKAPVVGTDTDREFLHVTGNWREVPVFEGAPSSSQSGKSGAVPTPSSGTWRDTSEDPNAYRKGQFLAANGAWLTPTGTTYASYGTATVTTAGAHEKGLVPWSSAPDGEEKRFLKADGTWGNPVYTIGNFTSASAGLAPAAKSGTTDYATSGYVLTGAGWKAGTKYNTDTTYGNASTASSGLMSTYGYTQMLKIDNIITSGVKVSSFDQSAGILNLQTTTLVTGRSS